MSHTFFITRARMLGFVSVVALLAVAIFLPGGTALAGAGTLPPGGTFIDDDGNTHEGMIEAIVAEGITLGCDAVGPRYCPDDDVRRDQMASFLARALNLPDSTTNWFPDDNGNTHEGAINSIADAGITLGLADGTYDPSGLVTRAQMASFLKRALGLPDSMTNWFIDDEGNIHEGAINSIADDGVTLGCDTNGNYCPTDNVRRDQMASFLGRALGLVEMIPPPPITTTTTTTTTTMATTSTTMGTSTQTITASGVSFSPSSPTVSNGAEVTFDNTSGIHDLMWESGSYPGWAPASSGWEVSFTAGTAGSFDFFCSVHGAAGGIGMSGTLTVNP